MNRNKVVYVCDEIDDAYGVWYVDWVEREWLTLSVIHKTKEFQHYDEALRFQQALKREVALNTQHATT